MAEAALEARGVVKRYRRRRGLGPASVLTAVDGVDLRIEAGTTLGLVGESGSGKSTLARIVTGVVPPDEGSVLVGGKDLVALRGAERRRARRSVQLVFQDPHASLNPRMTAASSVAEPLVAARRGTKDERRRRARDLLVEVGLPAGRADRYPHQLSGGEAQRVAIARALMLEPDVLVLDEPVSALDVSVQAQVLDLLRGLQERHGHAYLFISHDLAVVNQIADEVAVMYLGRVVEAGPRRALLRAPAHPYTQALVSAVPVPEARAHRARGRIVLRGDPPSPTEVPSGCRFRTRCSKATDACVEVEPPLVQIGDGRVAACHLLDPV